MSELASFKSLNKWSLQFHSELPWRKERTLYRTLVSEIMLQQTTVGTVLNHFEKFLLEYPTLFDLAKSTEEQVCISWKGLGYYRRAKNLRNVAIQITEQFKGIIPTDENDLLSLKGIGPYTANAIRAIGANQEALAVDANLERVLARFYGIPLIKGPKLQQQITNDFKAKKIVRDIIVLGPREFNESLMDLGREICQSRKAECERCPLKEDCKAFETGNPLSFPMPVNLELDLSDRPFIKLLRIIVKENKSEKILFYQKNEKEWLSGQWELPTFIFETNDESLKQYPIVKIKKSLLKDLQFKTGITKYKIENHVLEMDSNEFKKTLGIFKIEEEMQSKFLFKRFSKNFNASTASFKALKLAQLFSGNENGND